MYFRRSGWIQTNSTRIEINRFGSGDRNGIINFYSSDESESIAEAQIFRVAGENANLRIENRGTGNPPWIGAGGQCRS